MSGQLWICAGCEMIGSEEEAKAHRAEHGHTVNQLSVQQSEGVRKLWAEEQTKRAADLIHAARLLFGEGSRRG